MKTVTLVYDAGHTYKETWEPGGVPFCPECGQPTIWVECSEGDYYQGPLLICSTCGTSFTMPGYRPNSLNKQDIQRVKQLRDTDV